MLGMLGLCFFTKDGLYTWGLIWKGEKGEIFGKC